MRSNILYTLALSMLLLSSTTPLQAKERGVHVVREKVGQQYYLSACSSCHGEGKMAGNMATHREWKALLDMQGSELSYLHENVYKDKDIKHATKAIEYLKSEQFTKQKSKLLKFLQEFASDSASIPTCY